MTGPYPNAVVSSWDHVNPRWMIDGVLDETGPYLQVCNGDLGTTYLETYVARLVAKAILEACDAVDAEQVKREAEACGIDVETVKRERGGESFGVPR